MTSQPTFRILAASIALALAGAAHAQAPAAPSTAPAPATTTAPDAAKAATPAPAAKERTKRAPTMPTAKGGAPTGTPGVAAAPGTQTARPDRNKERRPSDTGGSQRQLQNAYADLMSPEEMAAHRAKVKKTRTYAECKTLFESTGKDMEARAKAQNKTLNATPTEICDKARERGRLTG